MDRRQRTLYTFRISQSPKLLKVLFAVDTVSTPSSKTMGWVAQTRNSMPVYRCAASWKRNKNSLLLATKRNTAPTWAVFLHHAYFLNLLDAFLDGSQQGLSTFQHRIDIY